jgi:hypothetical protein
VHRAEAIGVTGRMSRSHALTVLVNGAAYAAKALPRVDIEH